jgi:hypothetical protein
MYVAYWVSSGSIWGLELGRVKLGVICSGGPSAANAIDGAASTRHAAKTTATPSQSRPHVRFTPTFTADRLLAAVVSRATSQRALRDEACAAARAPDRSASLPSNAIAPPLGQAAAIPTSLVLSAGRRLGSRGNLRSRLPPTQMAWVGRSAPQLRCCGRDPSCLLGAVAWSPTSCANSASLMLRQAGLCSA